MISNLTHLSFENYFHLGGTIGGLPSDAQEHTSTLHFKTAQNKLLSISIKHIHSLYSLFFFFWLA